MKKSLLIIVGLFVCLLSNAATNKKGLSSSETCIGTHKKGLISGETWKKSKSPYCIDSAIFVASLTIEPGVEIRFCGNYVFEVGGILTAIGTPCDSIKFTRDTLSWQGIKFQNSLPGSVMAWCIVEKANTSGIRIIESFPKIYNCNIRNNQTTNSGAGLKISNTNVSGVLEIIYCTIEGNTTSTNYNVSPSYGGGVYVNSGTEIVRFKNCTIRNNKCTRFDTYSYGGGAFVAGKVEFILCNIVDNIVRGQENIGGGASAGNGGGIYVSNGSVNFFNSILNNNRAEGSGYTNYAYGGGIAIGNGDASFFNSIITNNTATSGNGNYGAGLFITSGKPIIENCTFADNNVHAIYNNSSTDTINVVNSILYFNNSNNAQVTGKINITYSDVQGGYPGTGNINFSPLFQGNGVYKIVFPSPCINAGNPAQQYKDACLPPSLGNTRNDMGAHGGPQACTWNDCGYTALISTVKGSASCNDGKIKVDLFGTLNSIQLKLYDSSNNLLRTLNAGNCVVTRTFNNLTAGNYTIKVKNANGCEQTYTARIKCVGAIAVSSADNMVASVTNDLVVYPNPTTGIINMKFNQLVKGDYKVILTDITGRRIMEKTIYAAKGESLSQLNLSNLANGNYLLQMKTSAGEKVIKVVKE